MENQRQQQLSARAASHHGVFTRRDALELGISDSTLSDAVRAGRFRRLSPGVFAVAGAPETLSQRMAAAVLSVAGLSALSHRTAARLWNLTDGRIRHIDVVAVRWDRVRRAGVNFHESLDLVEEDVVEREGLPVTTPVRTVVDLGALSPWHVERAFEAGIRRGLFTIENVEAFVARVARKGRRGVGAIRPLIESRRRWDTATESALEDAFRRLITDVGLPQPMLQYELRDAGGKFVGRADFAYPDERVLIELDSEAHHMDRLAFRSDRSKQNAAALMGWSMLRYTWWDIHEDPLRVKSDLKSALGLGRTHPPT